MCLFKKMPMTDKRLNHQILLDKSLLALQKNNILDAIQFMRKAAEIAPKITLYRRNLGELLRRVGQFDEAIALHQTVINQEPHLAENHFLLGLAYNDNRQFELAIQHYHIALSYDRYYGVVWNNLGASLESLGDKSTAKVAYATAIALNPKHVEAQNNLGAIYSEEGRLDEAHTHFFAAITAQPDFIDAHYNLSLIKTYTLDDSHLTFLQSAIKIVDQYPISLRIRYYFALGKALDDTKQYASAFKAYAEGNRLYALHKPWDKTKLYELVNQMLTVFTPSLFGIWMAELSDQECIMLGKKYLDRTKALAPDKQFIIDKMPANFFYIGMIYRMLPQAKIIHAIRDPMDSCFSCFTHLFKDDMLFAYDLTTLGEYYLLYAKVMQHWHEVLPKNTIFNLPYQAMIKDYEIRSKQLIEYIGLPWDPNCLHFYKNNRIVKTASLTQVRKPIYKTSLQRWKHFANELAPLFNIIAPVRNIKGISA